MTRPLPASLALLAALWPGAPARAHYPHDVARWAAISPDPSVPRVAAALERIDFNLLGRSDDGLEWAARLVSPGTHGGIEAAAFLTPGRLVLATSDDGLLLSDDAGDTFVRAPSVTDATLRRVVASPSVLVDGTAFAAGESAVWATHDGGESWWPVVEGDFVDVDVSPNFADDRRVCAATSTALACSGDGGGAWTLVDLPFLPYAVSVGADGRVWAAVRGGGVYASADRGANWALTAFAQHDVVVVEELSGGLVLVALAEFGEWRSDDAGATWEQVEVLTVTVDQSRDGVNWFDFIEGPDGAVYAAHWFGLGRSTDRGLTYTNYNVEPVRNVHSVVLTRGERGLSAWMGTYGGGPMLVDVATREVEVFPSLALRFARDTPCGPDWWRDGTALFDEGYHTLLTTDFGASWAVIARDEVEAQGGLAGDVKAVALTPDPRADPLLLAVVGERDARFLVSEDRGATWTAGAADVVCGDKGLAAAFSPGWPDDGRAWASCGGWVFQSEDRGRTWTALGEADGFVYEVARAADGAVLAATEAGIWRFDGAGASRLGLEGLLVNSVAAAADGTVFGLVPGRGLARSDDRGSTWTMLSLPTEDMPLAVAVSPDFSGDGTVAVAGYGGAWASQDRGGTWTSVYPLDVYEAEHEAWRATGSWERVSWRGASGLAAMRTQQPGATRTLDVRGVAVAVLAPPGAPGGEVGVSLDGGEPVRVAVTPGAFWTATGLDDGWHELRLEALSGTVVLDAVRVSTLLPEPAVAAQAPPACGCAGGPWPGGVAVVLGAALAARRARRR